MIEPNYSEHSIRPENCPYCDTKPLVETPSEDHGYAISCFNPRCNGLLQGKASLEEWMDLFVEELTERQAILSWNDLVHGIVEKQLKEKEADELAKANQERDYKEERKMRDY